jgi:hypothetical protein
MNIKWIVHKYLVRMKYCKVSWCRFSETHVTKGHKCGVCKQYGHGEIECGSVFYINKLKSYHTDILPAADQCTVTDCKYKEYHKNNAHHCPKCKERFAHTIAECRTEKIVKCPICRMDNTITDPLKLFGLNDECVVCCDKNVQIVLPQCKHCCLCQECFDKI